MMESAIYQITLECGNNCAYCLNEKKEWHKLGLHGQKDVISRLKGLGVKYLVISGGEPLEQKSFPDLVEHAYGQGFLSLVQTNGLNIDEKLLDRIKGKVIGLEVSLEGLQEEHNKLQNKKSFRKLLSKIQLAQSKGVEVFTNFTITKDNVKCIKDYVDMVNKLKIPIANFTTLYESGNALRNKEKLKPSKTQYKKFLQSLGEMQTQSRTILNVQGPVPNKFLKKFNIRHYSTCNAGNEMTVKPDGTITLCPAWPKKIGDIRTSSKDDLEKKLRKVRDRAGDKCLMMKEVSQW